MKELVFDHSQGEVYDAIGLTEEEFEEMKESTNGKAKAITHTFDKTTQAFVIANILGGEVEACMILHKLFGLEFLAMVRPSRLMEFFYTNDAAREFMCEVFKEFEGLKAAFDGVEVEQ